MSYLPRWYQTDITNRVLLEFRAGHKAVLAVLPTGGGKTIVFTTIAKNARAKGNRVIILVHREFLVRQTSEKLASLGVPHGIIAPGYPMTDELVQVASVDTLARRLDLVSEPTLIVVDEAHHTVAGKWLKILQKFPNALVLGVTATPERLDGTGLKNNYSSIVVGVSIKQLIAEKFLVPAIVYAPPFAVNLNDLRLRGGDYAKEKLEEALDQPSITGCAVATYKQHCLGIPAVAFCVTVAHAEHVAKQFSAAGIPAASIDGSMSTAQKQRLLDDLATGKILVLTSCNLISEGFDLPCIGAVILLRPTKSLALYLQQVGRSLRTQDGKEFAFVLDHVGAFLAHGLPEDDREWSLEGRKRSKRNVTPRVSQCPKCYAAFAPRRTCPMCKFEFTVQESRDEKLVMLEGELKPVDETAAKRADIAQSLRAQIGRCRSLDDLYALAQSKGYKRKWAEIIWAQRKRKNAS